MANVKEDESLTALMLAENYNCTFDVSKSLEKYKNWLNGSYANYQTTSTPIISEFLQIYFNETNNLHLLRILSLGMNHNLSSKTFLLTILRKKCLKKME